MKTAGSTPRDRYASRLQVPGMGMKWRRVCLLPLLSLFAVSVYGQESDDLWGGAELSLTHSNGYLRWSTSGPGNFPDILSELTWRDVRSSGGRLEAWLGRGELVASLSLSSAWIYDGRGQDSDYDDNDRTAEFSRSYNDITGDDFGAWSVSAGWSPPWLRYRHWQLQVVGGYGLQKQLLRMQNGVQTLSTRPPPDNVPLGPIPGLNSTYSASWYGPFIGGGVQGWLNKDLHLGVEYRWHLLEYYGWGHWNLRSDMQQPKSFEQTASGTGKILSLRATVPTGPVDFVLGGELEYLEALAGDTRFFLSNGQTVGLPLNQVVQRRWTVSAGISMDW